MLDLSEKSKLLMIPPEGFKFVYKSRKYGKIVSFFHNALGGFVRYKDSVTGDERIAAYEVVHILKPDVIIPDVIVGKTVSFDLIQATESNLRKAINIQIINADKFHGDRNDSAAFEENYFLPAGEPWKIMYSDHRSYSSSRKSVRKPILLRKKTTKEKFDGKE